VVVDGFSRKVVGWAMADHLRSQLASMPWAWRSPHANRRRARCSHRPRQHISYEFGMARRAYGRVAWMGRVGSAFDNAMAESFFATLK
jgi:putative transposase